MFTGVQSCWKQLHIQSFAKSWIISSGFTPTFGVDDVPEGFLGFSGWRCWHDEYRRILEPGLIILWKETAIGTVDFNLRHLPSCLITSVTLTRLFALLDIVSWWLAVWQFLWSPVWSSQIIWSGKTSPWIRSVVLDDISSVLGRLWLNFHSVSVVKSTLVQFSGWSRAAGLRRWT